MPFINPKYGFEPSTPWYSRNPQKWTFYTHLQLSGSHCTLRALGCVKGGIWSLLTRKITCDGQPQSCLGSPEFKEGTALGLGLQRTAFGTLTVEEVQRSEYLNCVVYMWEQVLKYTRMMKHFLWWLQMYSDVSNLLSNALGKDYFVFYLRHVYVFEMASELF